MSYRADKLWVDAHTQTHTQTDAGNDNTQRPKLASCKNEENNSMEEIDLLTQPIG